jgi:transcription termination factor Rho
VDFDFEKLEAKSLTELRDLAKSLDVSGYSRLKKEDLILRLLRAKAEGQGYIFGGGVLDIVDENIGFLRSEHYLPGPEDVYVSQSQIRRFGLRTGDMVIGQVRPPKDSEKYFGLLRVEAVNGIDPEAAKQRPVFEKLTPIFPNQRFNLETEPSNITTRLLDLVTPVGRGQRGLIVSPRVRQDHRPRHANAISTLPRWRLMVTLVTSPRRSDGHGPLGGCRGDQQHL